MSKGNKYMEPIPPHQQDDWNALIKRSKDIVTSYDSNNFELVLLAAEVTTEYGEGRLKRWSEEIGISYAKGKQLKSLARKGVDRGFILQWCRTPDNPNGLSYTVVRAIAGFNRSLNSDIAQHHLEYAYEHQSTVAGITGYMYEIDAPYDAKAKAERSIKQAIKDKQEHEGFSDYMAVALEQIIEENPDAEDAVLSTRISSEEDFRELEIKAGVREDLENNQIQFSRKTIDKMKRYRKAMQDIRHEARTSIGTGHELSEELRDAIKYLRDECNFILEVQVPSFGHLEDSAQEFSLDTN